MKSAHTPFMKRNVFKSSLLVGLFSLLACFPKLDEYTLKDVTKPYLGVYECTEVKWNREDRLDDFSYIHLELKENGKFTLYYQEKGGKKKKEEGEYTYDKAKQAVVLSGWGGKLKREFPLKEGVLTLNIHWGHDRLNMKFKQK